MPSTDEDWLKQCHPGNLPIPPFDRYIYILEKHVIKKPLEPDERGYNGYEPETTTVAQRDENELRALELVREYTAIPVPRLVYQGEG